MSTNGKVYPSTIPDKLQPHNLEAEEATVGSLLIDRDAIIFADFLKANDFYIERLGWVYEAIADLHHRHIPADLVTLSDELERRGVLSEIGGPAYLSGLINATPTARDVEYYAKIVWRTSIYRQLIKAAADISRLAYNTDEAEPGTVLGKASDILLKISTHNVISEPQPLSVFGHQILDDLEALEAAQGVPGIKTGLIDLDRVTGGLMPGLILIAGRPGMGKSALAFQFGKSAAQQNKSVLGFSLEMPGRSLMRRFVASESQINSTLLRCGPMTNDGLSKAISAVNTISQYPLFIDDRSRTIDEIRSKAILHHSKHGLDLMIVDYVQRIQSGRQYNNRDSEISTICNVLKDIAMDLEIPVVVVSSLNRKCEERHDKRPMLSDLRESGSLEYDADEVMFLYRDDYYNPDTNTPNVTEINIAKQREGAVGTINCFYRKELTTFISLSKEAIQF